MFYTAAWCAKDESEFRRELPLAMLSESMKRHASSVPFCIVMLEGMELLSPAYLATLAKMGFTVIDHTAAFKNTIAAYPNIYRHFTRYERNCLLRWIAFKELFCKSGEQQFWHLDADVLLYTSLDEIAADTKGKTFMLQGCPVLVSISDKSWFESYEAQLKALDHDLAGYSAAAAAKKADCLQTDGKLANRSAYRNPIASDQDLLQYLVSSRQVPQETATSVYHSRYFFIENPLSLNVPGFDTQDEHPLRFSMQDQSIRTPNDKRVPFLHLQNDLARYAQLWLVLKRWHVPAWIIRGIMRYRIDGALFERTIAFRALARIWFGSHPGWGRSELAATLLQEMPRRTPADLLNFLTQYSTPDV